MFSSGGSKPRRQKYREEDIHQLLEPIYLLSGERLGEGGGSSGPDPLAPVLRAISSSHQREAFTGALSTYIAQKDAEIERVCRDNYTEFLSSTEKLLKVRKGTNNLKHTLASLNNEIQEKGSVVAERKKEMLDVGRVAANMDESVQTLQACLRVLDLASKVQRLITVDKNYYAALRSLDDLLAIHIKPLLQFGFAQHMQAALPLTKLQIRAEVTTEFKSWLFDARQAGKELGRRAIEQYEKRARRWRERGVGSSASTSASAGSSNAALSKTQLNGPVEVGVSEKYEYNSTLLDDQTTKIDFKPLYQCIHIYDTLDALEDLQKSYQADRSSQASLILSESYSIQPFSTDVLSNLLEEIVGFFIIESYVLTSTSPSSSSTITTASSSSSSKIRFRTPEQVGELWTMMSERLASVITGGLGATQDATSHHTTKARLLSTVQTLQGFGYHTDLLNEILQQFLKRYSTILSREFEGNFKSIIGDDDNQGMLVDNADELAKVLDVAFLPTQGQWTLANIQRMPFPIELPFSPAYPLCCIDLRNMLSQFRGFAEGAVSSAHVSDAMLREALDRLLVGSIVGAMGEKIRGTGNLPGLAQLVGNLEFFGVACIRLGETLGARAPMEALSYFQTTTRQAVIKIISIISRQLDGFFEDARYDWLARAPPTPARNGEEEEPSGFLLDMVNYLSLSMDNQLASLSSETRGEVYRGALRHCAESLMGFFTDKVPQKISDNGLAYFAVDVRFMTALASNLPEQGLEEVFAELSQIIALLESDNPAASLDRDLRQMAYPSITSKKLHTVLLKLTNYYNGLDSASQARLDRKRRAELEQVLRTVARGSWA